MLSFLDQTEHKRPSTSLGTDQHEENDMMSEEDTQNDTESEEVSQESSPSSSASVLTDINPARNTVADAIKKQFSKSSRGKKERINDDIIAAIKERSAERNEIFKKIGPSKPDSLDLFFQSIAASVKALRPELINEAKLRTMHLVFELEQRNAGEPQPSPAPRYEPQPYSGHRHERQPSPAPRHETQPSPAPRCEPQPYSGSRLEPQPYSGPRHEPQPYSGPRHEPQPSPAPRHETQPHSGPHHDEPQPYSAPRHKSQPYSDSHPGSSQQQNAFELTPGPATPCATS
ncbi:protein TsetseEP-like [Sitophilus oryzae]|uniref:Protein TsetseEP-like n=1 Tax=Sitophilus oryzae TaxID=7048 RepID=A0A6J2Y1G1_SITOR|nr:protein TsetseEP-like [Sitophilus oryzae]